MDEAKRTELEGQFQKFDTDGNGTIDENEFAKLLQSLNVSMSTEEVQVAFNAIDIDASGQIDFGEFCQWWVNN